MSISINGTSGLVFNDASTQNTAATGFGFKNRIINGGAQVGQRGNVVFSSTNNLYGWCDRWLMSISGTTVSALGYQASGQPTKTGYAVQFGNVVTTGATTVTVQQRIESANCLDLNSNSITFSGQVKQTSGSTQTLTLTINKANAVDNFSGVTQIGATTVSVPNNTWTPFTFTIALGATDASNGIAAVMAYGSLGAQSTSQFYYGDLQLEKGSTATSFDYRSYGTELALCQRYFCQFGGQAAFEPFGLGIGTSSTAVSVQLPLPVSMRTAPTGVTVLNVGNLSGTFGTPTGASFDTAGYTIAMINFTYSSGVTTGGAARMYAGASTAPRVQFSTEL
jgi:hypothetical protein